MDRSGGGEDVGAERAQAALDARRGGSVECGDPADRPPGPVSGGAVDAAAPGSSLENQNIFLI